MEAEFVDRGRQTRLRLHSVESDGTPRNFFDTTVRAHVTRNRLVSRAPGRGGAGRLRDRSGRSRPAPTRCASTRPSPARRRWADRGARRANAGRVPLAGHQPAAAGRAAWRDRRSGTLGETAALDAWAHTLGTTTAARDLWPWLLLLALLLWPLDVAIRRVSIGRRDVVAGRAWIGERWHGWRGPAKRTAPLGGMLAAKERASGSAARGALLRRGGVSEEAPLPVPRRLPRRLRRRPGPQQRQLLPGLPHAPRPLPPPRLRHRLLRPRLPRPHRRPPAPPTPSPVSAKPSSAPAASHAGQAWPSVACWFASFHVS